MACNAIFNRKVFTAAKGLPAVLPKKLVEEVETLESNGKAAGTRMQ